MVDATLSHPDFHGTVTAAGGPAAAWDDGPPADPPGYELLGEVGRGGMGVVFRARDLALNREVAVKLLRPGTGPGSTAAARFVEEARVTGQLQHPGIPAVYQVGTLSDGRPFLAMKLIQGRTLDELLKAGAPLDPLRVFEAICHAVGYAHAHGVIHRDLKPHNVMVGAFGEVQVMDWGLAKRIRDDDAPRHAEHPSDDSALGTGYSELTQHGSVLGTLAYMPPEQAAGDHARVGPPADVFGLGAILCVLLTGKPPHAWETLESLYVAATEGDTTDAFARLDGCGADPAVVVLGKRCLAFDPAARPPTGDAVATEIAAIRAAADDRARRAEVDRVAAAVRAGEGAKRRRLIQWAAAAVMVVLAVGVTVSLWQAKVARREAFDAETARANAEAAGRAEAAARARAASRLDKAVEAVEKAVTRVGTARWARTPALAAERRQVLADAVAFYEGFGEADDPVVRRETARAHRRIGATYLLLADYPAAVGHLARARAGCEALVAEFPEDSGAVADLAEARLFVAHEAASTGRLADAQAAYRDATAAARRAVAARPSDDDTRRTLVSCLVGLAFFTMQTDLPAAGVLFADALRETDDLLARPAVPFATRALAAHTLASAATFDLARGQLAEGLAKVKRATAIHAETPPDPTVPARHQDLFDVTGGILKMTDAAAVAVVDPERGAALFRQAAETFDTLLAAYPKAFPFRLYQVMILSQEIDVLTRLKRTAEADKRRAELRVARAVFEAASPNLPPVGLMAAARRSNALAPRAAAGDVADLDREADDLLEAAGPAGDIVRYNVACALAQGSRHGPAAGRERRAARAVELLNGLLAGAFYRGQTNAAHIAQDTDLDSLRERPDFKAFVAELTKKFPPPAKGK